MDNLLTPLAVFGAVVGVLVLAFCWLIYATRAGRPVKLNLEGLGIKLNIDTSAPRDADIVGERKQLQ